jgi:hypothetical protein
MARRAFLSAVQQPGNVQDTKLNLILLAIDHSDETLPEMVGVLHSRPIIYATIPVDNDDSQSKKAAAAIANPGDQPINVSVALVAQDCNIVANSLVLTTGPKKQVAQYLQDWEVPKNFKGSLVIRGVNAAAFVAVPLLDKQGVLTALPLISGKAPSLPN